MFCANETEGDTNSAVAAAMARILLVSKVFLYIVSPSLIKN